MLFIISVLHLKKLSHRTISFAYSQKLTNGGAHLQPQIIGIWICAPISGYEWYLAHMEL